MSIKNVLASVAVKDLSAACPWYQTLLGRPADSVPMAELAECKFEGGGWLQVYQLLERAGTSSFTLAVGSIDEQVARLEKMNIHTSERSSGETVKTLMSTDPDGNHIVFAETTDPSMAQ